MKNKYYPCIEAGKGLNRDIAWIELKAAKRAIPEKKYLSSGL